MNNESNNKKEYICIKCSHKSFSTGEMRVAGGFWSKVFDIQGRKLMTVSCDNCGYTELFKKSSNMGSNIFDYLVG